MKLRRLCASWLSASPSFFAMRPKTIPAPSAPRPAAAVPTPQRRRPLGCACVSGDTLDDRGWITTGAPPASTGGGAARDRGGEALTAVVATDGTEDEEKRSATLHV